MHSLIAPYAHISFGLDGTLVHTIAEYRHRATSRTICECGGAVPSDADIDRFWFETGRGRIIEEVFKIDVDRFWKQFRLVDANEARGASTFAYEDVEPALQRMKQDGKIISIVTGAPERIAQMEIAKLNNSPIDHCFSITYSGFDEKPAPDSFFHVLEHLNCSAKETLYIGNSNEDALYAHNAETDFCTLSAGSMSLTWRNTRSQPFIHWMS